MHYLYATWIFDHERTTFGWNFDHGIKKSSWIFDHEHASIGLIFLIINHQLLLGKIVMKQLCIIFSLLFSTCFFTAHAEKILIITHAFNRPDFIAYQAKLFKKFLRDQYRFIVFNDAKDETLAQAIRNCCQANRIPCIGVPQEIQKNIEWASKRTANAIEYSLLTWGFSHNGIVFIIDSDMFLIKPVSLTQLLGDHDLYGEPQSNGEIRYLWNGLLLMNMPMLPNKDTISFCPRPINGTPLDTGGQLHHYLKDNPSIRLKTYGDVHIQTMPRDTCSLKTMGFDELTCSFISNYDPEDTHGMQFHAEYHFLHYRGGGNWMHKVQEYHKKKTAYLFDYLDALLAQ